MSVIPSSCVSPRSYFPRLAIGAAWTMASKNHWEKVVGKALRRANSIQIHGGKELDVENKRFASI